MRAGRLAFVVAVVGGIVGFGDSPSTQTPAAAFHAVGDLSGGGFTTIIRDATRVDGVIYAVGGAVASNTCTAPCNGTDTAVLWRFDGANATLTPIPNIVATASPLLGPVAWAITPDASHFAAQLRAQPSPPQFTTRAARIAAQGLTVLDLIPGALSPTAARAISDTGAVLYGSTSSGAVRFEVSGPTTPVPPLPTHTTTSISPRGTSGNGTFAVGSSVIPGVLRRAIRYEHGSGVTEIPLLPGATHGDGLGISHDGDLVLVTSNGDASPKGEAYLYRFSTDTIQRLGSPNAAWSPGGQVCANDACTSSTVLFNGMWMGGNLVGGVTDDGSVVAMSFFGPDGQNAFIRNAHGWFHLTSVLGAHGIDLAANGWNPNTLLVTGMSSDGTLVFGAGEREGVVDGFVASFAPGVLASFNPQPAPPASTALVGVWSFVGDSNEPVDLSAPDHVVVFTDGGVYYHVEGEPGEPLAGFERGIYTFDGTRLAITTLFDTNGSTGLSDVNGTSFSVAVNDDTLWEGGDAVAFRIAGSPGSIVGGWVGGNPAESHNSFLIAFAQINYFAVYDFPDGSSSESGTYTWNPVTHELIATVGGHVDDGNFATLAPDARSLMVVGDGETFTVNRVIDPATIPVIANSPLFTASGVVGETFSYPITATNTAMFSAAGLPDGLVMDSGAGTISGTPTVGGQFVVTVRATNSEGVSDIETLVLTIAIPTPVGQDVVVEPEVPEGQGPITLTFDEITTAGTTTVEVIDLDDIAVPPPGNVNVGGVIYEVSTTATFSGLITLCFSYAGIDFGDAEPRLFHFENGVWVDITTSVDPETQTICGATTTLSPFAVLISNVERRGFYAPVSPIPGFLNVVKGGTTVPLRFEIFVNGIEQTTTTGLMTTQQEIECDANAPVDEVEAALVTGGTSLRYDAGSGHFIQNWRVPNTPGRCYMVQVTTLQDALALTARFKVR